MPQTKDGWTISTVEQEGDYAGEEMGKVWLKSPTPRTNTWHWYQCEDVEHARYAALHAETVTQVAFEAWHTAGADLDTPAE